MKVFILSSYLDHVDREIVGVLDTRWKAESLRERCIQHDREYPRYPNLAGMNVAQVDAGHAQWLALKDAWTAAHPAGTNYSSNSSYVIEEWEVK